MHDPFLQDRQRRTPRSIAADPRKMRRRDPKLFGIIRHAASGAKAAFHKGRVFLGQNMGPIPQDGAVMDGQLPGDPDRDQQAMGAQGLDRKSVV